MQRRRGAETQKLNFYEAGRAFALRNSWHRRSKVEFQIYHGRSLAGQLGIKGQRIEPIIAVGEIQNADGQFDMPAWEPITKERVELPEIVAGHFRRRIALGAPDRLDLAEEAGRMIVNRKEVKLMQRGLRVRIRHE